MATKDKTEAKPDGKASSNGADSEGTLSITDSRTGENYEVEITDGTIKTMDLRQIKVNEDDFGLMGHDPAFTNTSSCRSSITYIDGEAGIPKFFLGTFDKAEFDVAADYRLDDLGRVADGNGQRHARIGLVEIDQSRWQEMTRYRLAGLDRETPASQARELAHCEFHGLGAIDQVARFVKQQLASLCYDYAPPHTMKQFCAELALEGRHCRRY